MLDKIMQVFETCEAEKMKAFEQGIRAQDLSKWNAQADRLELAAYQKIKIFLREARDNGMLEL